MYQGLYLKMRRHSTAYQLHLDQVVTMTTVGFGDYAPISTNVQKVLAVLFIMLSITLLLGRFDASSKMAEQTPPASCYVFNRNLEV